MNLKTSAINNRLIIKILLIFFVFLFFLISFLRVHVYNFDFWWHLANGKYIVENQTLPQNDLFSYTASDTASDRKSLILKGYWLAETIFYKIFDLWSFKGIIVLRALLLLAFLITVFLVVKQRKISDFTAIALVSCVFYLSLGFMGERPQLFTFLIFALIYYLLEEFRLQNTKKVFLVPILIVLLSNMHVGYISCIFLITVYLAAYGFKYFIKKEQNKNSFKILLIVWVVSILFSAFNPNHFIVFNEIFSLGKYSEGIIESMPTFYLYFKKISPMNYSYMIFLSLSLLIFRYFKKIDITQTLLLLSFSVISFISIRYVIFYMCVAAPVIANLFLNVSEEKVFKKPINFLAKKEFFLNLIALVIAVFFVFNAIPSLAKYEFREDVSFAAPKDAADFLSGLEIKGNMFNEYGIGGYLIWKLYPNKKVFIDGRGLEHNVLNEYNSIMSASENSVFSWENLMEKYNISYVITPPLLPHGEIYPLVEKLLDEETWSLIYSDHLALIFIKNDSSNLEVIKKFKKNKEEGINTIIIQASARAMRNKNNPYYLITLGKMFYKTGRIDDAEKAFIMAYEIDRQNKTITEWLIKLRENKQLIDKSKSGK